MSIEQFELSWRVGAERFTVVVSADGVPLLTCPAGTQPVVAERKGPARRGQAWKDEEEDHLRDGFARGETVEALAAELGRTRGSVAARLVRMGLLDESEAGLRYPVPRAVVAVPAVDATTDAPG